MQTARSRVDTARGSGGVYLRSAFLVSSLGDWIYRFAVPTLVLELTGSALSTAIAYVLELVPYTVVGLVAGVAADRWNRRRILISCDLIAFGIAVVITVLAMTDRPPIGLLYLCAFLLATVRPFHFPAFQGFLVDTVPKQRLSRVNAWTQTVDSMLGFVGPIAGTLVIAALGVPLATLINALSFALSAVLIYQIVYVYRRPTQGVPGRAALAGIGRDFVDGLRAVWSIRPIWWGTWLMAGANLAAFVVEGSLVYLILEVAGLPKVALGVIFAAQGVGAVLGAVLAPRLIDRYPAGRLIAAGMGLSMVAMFLPVLQPAYWLITFGSAVEGVATSVIVVSWFTARHRIVPAHLIGRVVSVSRAVAYLTIPLGAIAGGLVAGSSPLRTVFACGAVIQAAVFLGTVWSPLSKIDEVVTAPAPEPSVTS